MKSCGVIAAAVFAIAGCAQPGAAPATPAAAAPAAMNKSLPQGPSYAQRIRAAILPYIVLAEPIEGNPAAQVKVTTRPNGEVVDAELVESSGFPGWDESVRLAVLKAGRIPFDVDGKVPPVLVISFRPKQ